VKSGGKQDAPTHMQIAFMFGREEERVTRHLRPFTLCSSFSMDCNILLRTTCYVFLGKGLGLCTLLSSPFPECELYLVLHSSYVLCLFLFVLSNTPLGTRQLADV